ncbi:carbohydrate binding domain-containing protein [Clostridium frigoris]|uniref:Carbohydrate binding domain-containing protein n=1 Tax=Clostridium frigoris TaxID=205327 RepID=A0ABS6BRE8_9CLOT|nr:Ig-like domain-containing protein [Clostridium frigoris]MBU3158457.1 carbohydrate binding domain-containing protein [Clostridium frigoris]
MKKTNTKIFSICLAATMVGTSNNFATRTLAVETTQPTVQSISHKVTKKVPGVSVKKISLDKKIDLQVGTGATKTTQQLVATITPTNATNKNATWTSSNTKVAKVSATGLVTAVKAGSAKITVISADGHKKAKCKVTVKTVNATIIPVIGVTLDKTTVSHLPIGTGATKITQQLVATISPTNATNKNVTWTSSDTSVATVSATGLVTAVKTGSATITATSEDGAKLATSGIIVTAFTAGSSDQIDSLWTQKWNDEFSGTNGTTIDASKWMFDIGKGPNGDGWGNKELETYTNSTDNVYQQDGNLVIAANKDATGNITSGRIKTKGSLDMKYGRVDVRAKLPTGTGYWPAIWMLPSDNVYGIWASSGEMDIMENKGSLPNEVYGTLHYGAAWPNNKYTGKTYNFPSGTDVTSFHTYSMEWEPGEVRWYVDGHLYQTQNNWSTTDTNGEKVAFPAPFDQNFHLILNLAYGGNFDGGKGDKSNIPGKMEVDYVRAYDLTGRPYKTPVEPSAPIQNADASKEPLYDGNRIYNGIFDKGSIDRMAYWNFNVAGATATASVSEATRELFVDVSNGGTDRGAITLEQKGIQLTQKSIYELKFKARAKAARTIKVGVLSKDGTVSYNDEQTINLTTEMEEKTFSFTMDDATDLESQIVFELGGDNNGVYIDDVSLIPTYEFIDYSVIDCYPLKNGDFSKGLDLWTPYPNIGDGGVSTITSANGEAKISVTAPGPNPYSVMLNQEGLKFTKGVEYLLAFDVKSSAARNITATIDNADYDQYLSKTVQAGTEFTHYEYTLKLSKDDTVNLKFLLGNVDAEVPTSAHDIIIDNVKLEAKNAPFKNPPTLAPSETNNKLTQPIDVSFSDDAAWTDAITSVKINDTVVAANKYTVSAGKIAFATENFATANDYNIVVVADGYANATCVQNIKANNDLIINNGTFDTNVAGWENYIADGSDAVITSVDEKMKVNLPGYAGWEKWSTMIFQNTIKLEAGKKYVLSFDASSTVSREAWLEMTNLENKTLALTPTNKTFTYEFTAGATITDGSLKFLLGTEHLDGSLFAENQSVSIDNVSIIEKTVTPIVTTATTVAAGITSVVAPSGTATSLTLPTVPAGYTIAIKSSNNTDVIATNAAITSPDAATTVALVFTVTKTADGTTADTTSINVVVPLPGETPISGEVVAVSQTDTTVLNAESAFNIVNGSLVDNDATETGKSLQTNVTAPMTFDFNVNVAASGKYAVTFRENSTPAGCNLFLFSNGITKFNAAGPGAVNATDYTDVTREIELKAGEQIISISGVPGSASMLKIKSITLKPIEIYTAPVIVGDLTAISSNAPTKLEAENAINIKNATVALNDTVEGGSSLKATANISFDFNVDVAVAGQYQITYRTNCNPDGLDLFLKSNGLLLRQAAAPSGGTWGNTTMTVSLDAGPQVLSINGITGAGSIIQMNNIILTPTGGGSTGASTSISNTAPTVLEAESATNVTNATVVANDTTIGGSSLKSTLAGNPMTFDFNVNVATAGQYTMTYRTATIGPSGVYMELSKGGVLIKGTGVGPSVDFTDTTVAVTLEAGAQVLKVFGAPGESTILKVNKVTIAPIQ